MGSLSLSIDDVADQRDDLLHWIKESGYPYDWSSRVEFPEWARRPLAEIWYSEEGGGDEGVDEWEATMGMEAGW